jgi:hypothetical protein
VRILVYKRTHNGDPDQQGCFGVYDCMGSVRNRDFDAVIGVGGIGREARSCGIAGQVNWIGIGPTKHLKRGWRGSVITFEHFYDFGTDGPDFWAMAPTLSKRMYSKNVRHLMKGLNEQEYHEATLLLKLAENAPPSSRRAQYGGTGARRRRCLPNPNKGRCRRPGIHGSC